MILLTIKQQMFVNVCLKIFSFHYEVGDFSTVLTSEWIKTTANLPRKNLSSWMDLRSIEYHRVTLLQNFASCFKNFNISFRNAMPKHYMLNWLLILTLTGFCFRLKIASNLLLIPKQVKFKKLESFVCADYCFGLSRKTVTKTDHLRINAILGEWCRQSQLIFTTVI